MTDIYKAVAAERERAHVKHRDTSMESVPAEDPTGRRYRVLMEEVGEVAREFNDAEHETREPDLGRVRSELVQVAAMAIAWAEACEGRPLAILSGERCRWEDCSEPQAWGTVLCQRHEIQADAGCLPLLGHGERPS